MQHKHSRIGHNRLGGRRGRGGRGGSGRDHAGRVEQADLWPVKECVQKPPSMSHTLADLSALAVASRPPVPSTAMCSTGARWPCKHDDHCIVPQTPHVPGIGLYSLQHAVQHSILVMRCYTSYDVTARRVHNEAALVMYCNHKELSVGR